MTYTSTNVHYRADDDLPRTEATDNRGTCWLTIGEVTFYFKSPDAALSVARSLLVNAEEAFGFSETQGPEGTDGYGGPVWRERNPRTDLPA